MGDGGRKGRTRTTARTNIVYVLSHRIFLVKCELIVDTNLLIQLKMFWVGVSVKVNITLEGHKSGAVMDG